MSNKKNCVNIPGAICNIKSSYINGKRRLEGLKRVRVSLKTDSMNELESRCRSACQNSDQCYGSFGMSSSKSKRCYHCTTPKNPLRYDKVKNLQVCDDGTNPRYNYHGRIIDYSNLTSGFLELLNEKSSEYNTMEKRLRIELEDLESVFNSVKTEKEQYIEDYTSRQEEFMTIKTELETLMESDKTKQNRIDDLLSSLEEVNDDIDEYQNSIDELNDLHQTLELEYTALEQEYNTLEEEFSAFIEESKIRDNMFDLLDNDVDGDGDGDGDGAGAGDGASAGAVAVASAGAGDPRTRSQKTKGKPKLPPHMITAETDDKICGDETLQEFYERNSERLEKCHDDKRWICEDDQWKCPNDEYDCSWGGKYAPIRRTTTEHCYFGRECGKFGLGGCRRRSIPTQGFGPVNTSAVDAMVNAGKGLFGGKSE